MSSETDPLRIAQRALGAFLARQIDGASDPAEDAATLHRAAQQLRDVMDATEEGARFDRAHHFLDLVGQLLHKHLANYHCALHFHDGGYSRACPVDLAHLRLGLSVGFTARIAECSICGKDPNDCDHVRGFEYDGEVCVRRIIEADLHEVSLVDRPAYPMARLKSVPVANKDLRRQFGSDFSPGVRIACNKCESGGCLGLKRPLAKVET